MARMIDIALPPHRPDRDRAARAAAAGTGGSSGKRSCQSGLPPMISIFVQP